MKKICKTLAFALCLSLITQITALADLIITVVLIENQSGQQGDTVVVPLRLEGGAQIGGFEITVMYDSEILHFESFEWGEIVSGGLFDFHHRSEDSAIRFIFVTAGAIRADGVMGNLTFVLLEDCEDGLPIGVPDAEIICDGDLGGENLPIEVSGMDEIFQNTLDAPNIVVAGTGQGGSNPGTTGEEGNHSNQEESAETEGEQEQGSIVVPDEDLDYPDNFPEDTYAEVTPEESIDDGLEAVTGEISAVTEDTEQENRHQIENILTMFLIAIAVIIVGGLMLWRVRKRKNVLRITAEPELEIELEDKEQLRTDGEDEI